MGLWLRETDRILHEYLKKAAYREKCRALEPDEMQMVLELRETEKQMTVCVVELITMQEILRAAGEKEIYWITNNLHRMIRSLIGQKKLVSAIRLSVMGTVAPEEKEKDAIRKVMRDIHERLRYLHAIPIPENLRLTWIHDYLEVTGETDFAQVIRRKYPTMRAMVDLQEDQEALGRFLEEMRESLIRAGREDDWKDRLREYIWINQKRDAEEKARKAEEKRKEAERESMNGMNVFRQEFFKGIRTLEGSKAVGLSRQAVHNHLAAGDRGKFVVLCCRYSMGRLLYRYVKADGELKTSFAGVGMWDTYQAASEALPALRGRWPGSTFEVVAI